MSDYRERNVCPLCGSPAIRKRVRHGDYHCRQCQTYFTEPALMPVKINQMHKNAFGRVSGGN